MNLHDVGSKDLVLLIVAGKLLNATGCPDSDLRAQVNNKNGRKNRKESKEKEKKRKRRV